MRPGRRQANEWQNEYKRVSEALKHHLGNKETCGEVIDGYEVLIRSIREFTARLLGDAGARSVLARSLQLAAREAPLLQKLRLAGDRFDFGELRAEAEKLGCSSGDVLHALLAMSFMVFRTLEELAGDALTEPLLRQLEEPD